MFQRLFPLIKTFHGCNISVMDISVFVAICRELAGELPGLRIVELTGGGAGEICLTFKGPERKLELLVCPRPDMPRIYLCSGRPCRAKSLTPSAQAIRNYIIGSTVISVEQEGLERAARFRLARKGREGAEELTLVYEMAGKKPNLIVLDGGGRVLVAQTYVPLSDEALRPILPGITYEPPPRPDKLDPFKAAPEDIAAALDENPAMSADKALFKYIGGISPLLAREAVFLAGGGREPERLHEALRGLLERALSGPYSPGVVHTAKGPALAALTLAQYEGSVVDTYGSMSEAAEACYSLLAERKRFEAEKREIRRDAARRLESAKKRLIALRGDMARSENADTYSRYGNLLMAQLKSVPEGADEAGLDDLFSEEGGRITVPLDPRLSAVKNAERYFSMARKALSGAKMIEKRLKSTEEEVLKLETALDGMDRAEDFEELGRITGQRERPGIKTGGPTDRRVQPRRFPHFISSDGYEVLYGTNARANDALTFKLAEPMDLWLHAQGYHGAHVIVKNPDRRPDIPLNTILEAAACAAWFSGARKDSSVPVDYTFKKYVRKPRDPVSGQAIFTQNKAVFVDPKKPEAEG